MSALLWPGDHRAGERLSDAAVVRAMAEVETAWMAALAEAGVVPADAAVDLTDLVGAEDVRGLAESAEDGGNPVIPLVGLLRERLRARLGESHPAAARLHAGLTSQDVLDTALVLELRRTADEVLAHLDAQVATLSDLARAHRATVTVGRTLTQYAVPVTFGLVAATWLQGLLDARDDLRAARGRLPASFGGAAGTLAAPRELLAPAGADVLVVVASAARRLGLEWATPWHTSRAPMTRVGDALTGVSDAYGRIAADVLARARPEVAELREGAAAGRGGSSTMPHKSNPVLSVQIRRTALAAPGLAAQLHLAAATSVDQRPDGAWHTEWETLALLGRRVLAASSQVTELLSGLEVDAEQMARRADEASENLLAEQRRFGDPGPDAVPADYLGATEQIIDAVLQRADRTQEGRS